MERTPAVLNQLLAGLSEEWTHENEGEGTWSPFDVLGHLIHGEKTDWIPRTKIIIENGPDRPFDPYDRFAQLSENQERSIESLLEEFARLRDQNLHILTSFELDEPALDKKGTHPGLGEVTLRELLAAWIAHDLGHIVQICRVMAKQYKGEVGPWQAYLAIVN